MGAMMTLGAQQIGKYYVRLSRATTIVVYAGTLFHVGISLYMVRCLLVVATLPPAWRLI